jgi:hypothetical protein
LGFALRGEARVDACDDALRGGFLVPRGTIDLASKPLSLYSFRFERWPYLTRVDIIILDAISWLSHFNILKANDGS